jgi:glycosyltransferase involved in cell wall biosynthesis
MCATAEPRRRPALQVLVPYILTYQGGVRTVLGAGLPRLVEHFDLQVTYTELCRDDADMDDMERSGVRVDRYAGVAGPSALSRRSGWRRGTDLARQTKRLLGLARRLSPRMAEYDICYVHGHRELLIATLARSLSRRSDRPALVWHWHGPPLSVAAGARGSWLGRRVAGLGSRACARVIAISRFCARQTVSMGVDPYRVVTVLNAAAVRELPSSAETQPLPMRPDGAFVSLIPCASIRWHKGLHVAVEALSHLPSNYELWVTGDPADPVARSYVAGLRHAAAAARAEARLHFLGPRRDIHRVMTLADLVLVPSVWEEPFGLVVAEAQLLGVPVAVSTRGALPELVEGGNLGLTFDVANPRSVAAALTRAAAEAPSSRQRAEAVRRQASARYGYDRWCREVADVLWDAASAPHPRMNGPPKRRSGPGLPVT